MRYELPKGATPDGELTRFGIEIVRQYALAWVGGNERNLDLERKYPELTEAFYTVRLYPDYAREQIERAPKLVVPV